MVFIAIVGKPNLGQPCFQVETAQVTDLTARRRNEVSALIPEAGNKVGASSWEVENGMLRIASTRDKHASRNYKFYDRTPFSVASGCYIYSKTG